MISHKHILKGTEAFELVLSRFTVLTVSLQVRGHERSHTKGLVKAGACDGQMGHEQVDEAASHRSGVSQAVNSTTQIQAGSFDGVN